VSAVQSLQEFLQVICSKAGEANAYVGAVVNGGVHEVAIVMRGNALGVQFDVPGNKVDGCSSEAGASTMFAKGDSKNNVVEDHWL
jgi:hypothetical protein